MITLTQMIDRFLEALRHWYAKEREIAAHHPADDATTMGVANERNTSFWYLPPPL